MTDTTLTPAQDLAGANKARVANESVAYREARTALLKEEIELRRKAAEVAEHRRNLPPGAEITRDYVFEGENGPVHFADLFGERDTLIVYNYMFGPERKRPCPMCTATLASIDGVVPDIQQNAAFAVVARSPIERLVAFKEERGWNHLQLYTDTSEDYGKDFHAWLPEGDSAAFNVFTRKGGVIRHFWGDEMGMETMDAGQDPRGQLDMTPLWTILDVTPAGRLPKWYPKVDYKPGDSARMSEGYESN